MRVGLMLRSIGGDVCIASFKIRIPERSGQKNNPLIYLNYQSIEFCGNISTF